VDIRPRLTSQMVPDARWTSLDDSDSSIWYDEGWYSGGYSESLFWRTSSWTESGLSGRSFYWTNRTASLAFNFTGMFRILIPATLLLTQ
jgi:hypothetical protein